MFVTPATHARALLVGWATDNLPAMPLEPKLKLFVDDELPRLPAVIDAMVQAVASGRVEGLSKQIVDLEVTKPVQSAAYERRHELAHRFVEEMRRLVTAGPAPAATETGRPKAVKGWSLVDESELAHDIELAHATESISVIADAELRELGAYTSAMLGDSQVSLSTNPFNADTFARALWVAASVLPATVSLSFVRQASMPLGLLLRRHLAGMCTRLEGRGFEPGNYSTVVQTHDLRFGSDDIVDVSPELPNLRSSMPVTQSANLDHMVAPTVLDNLLRAGDERVRGLPPTSTAAAHVEAIDSQRNDLVNNAATTGDQQSIELLGRLFDALLTDTRIPEPILLLLSRLHGSAVRLALRDVNMLESYDHEVWKFIDRMAFAVQVHPRTDDSQYQKLMAFIGQLIDHVSLSTSQDAALYKWADDRLAAMERNLFAQRLKAAAKELDALQARDHSEDESDTGAIDVNTLETVPGALSQDSDAIFARSMSTKTAALIRGQPAGEWVRMYMNGGWIVCQLLWRSDTAALWLYSNATEGGTIAMRRRAVERLIDEGMMRLMVSRSLVRRAAKAVMHGITGEPIR